MSRVHGLSEFGMVEMLFIHYQKRRAMNLLEEMNAADDANVSIVLDSATIFDVFLADEHHSTDRQPVFAQSSERKQRVIDRSQSCARGDEYWKSNASHEVAHQIALVERNHHSACSLNNPFPPRRRRRKFKFAEIYADSSCARRKMR